MVEKMTENTARRKAEHIRICLEESVQGRGVTTGFEDYRLRHSALPEMAFADVSLETSFLGRRLRTPLLISSMTGGTGETGQVNRRLAEAAEARGWAMGLGSLRAALEREELAATFDVRREAPSALIFANLGGVQLNYGVGPDDCLRAVHMAQADALVFHFNALQEVFQPGGNTDFRGLYGRLEEVCRRLTVPVGVKEVGWGIDGATARRLSDAGVAFIDAAGAGGTSWSQVEKHRQTDPLLRVAAEAFEGWGIPTADCVREIRAELPDVPLIASGGLASGVDAAKALALGADLAGFGRSLLREAATGGDLHGKLERVELELRIAMFASGTRKVADLRSPGTLRQING
ncbi:type 2 isopentenyl-diphosphate Delta-isomerase [Cohnella sp. CFH 77786]|uniref:type 2 isopentenyl-diphosphate Delta-isomerase n=1 Tax=Cohnella sp. CFH 77786 TaxID=2662265 RepID=UPI001C60B692|nr:type 2 isopentenyl-diphosphate Delta-isomerase [Cohnella sp. CFH 77786]MBW5447809.1 type 2 isopentenyl-diphosphate Delta-isomerase [Cohnella sp. CFH 77786]